MGRPATVEVAAVLGRERPPLALPGLGVPAGVDELSIEDSTLARQGEGESYPLVVTDLFLGTLGSQRPLDPEVGAERIEQCGGMDGRGVVDPQGKLGLDPRSETLDFAVRAVHLGDRGMRLRHSTLPRRLLGSALRSLRPPVPAFGGGLTGMKNPLLGLRCCGPTWGRGAWDSTNAVIGAISWLSDSTR